jgi:hypothetical protein
MSFKRYSDETTERRDPKQELVDMVIGQLEQGRVPWKREWDPSKCAGPQAPFNPVNKHFYRESISFSSSVISWPLQLPIPDGSRSSKPKIWGGTSRKDQGRQQCFLQNRLPLKTAMLRRTMQPRKFISCGRIAFFTLPRSRKSQSTRHRRKEAPWTRPEAIDIILKNCGCTVQTGGSKAFYAPLLDLIQLPPDVAFSSREYWLYVAKIRFATLKQPLPRNSDGGDLPDEDVMRVAHRDS